MFSELFGKMDVRVTIAGVEWRASYERVLEDDRELGMALFDDLVSMIQVLDGKKTGQDIVEKEFEHLMQMIREKNTEPDAEPVGEDDTAQPEPAAASERVPDPVEEVHGMEQKIPQVSAEPVKIETPIEPEPATEWNEPKRVSGFLIIDCEKCEKRGAFFSKGGIRVSECKSCGHKTKLWDMKKATCRCDSCEKIWKYKTNSTKSKVEVDCVACGAPMVSYWNAKKNEYQWG